MNLEEKINYVLQERAKGRTLEDIGNEMHLTRERIRQLEAKGIRMKENQLVKQSEEKEKTYIRTKYGIYSNAYELAYSHLRPRLKDKYDRRKKDQELHEMQAKQT